MDDGSRDMTAFLTPLGMLHLTSLPTGYTNSPAEFQECMVFILHDELTIADVFIDDLHIRGPTSTYPDKHGNPSTLPENPEIRRFIWEHANDVHQIMHRIKDVGATFSAPKMQLCLEEVKILGQTMNIQGRVPDQSKVDNILKWPPPQNVKKARGFLGLCGTVRIWIPNHSALTSPIMELWRKETNFKWSEQRQAAFDALKQAVTSAPALWPIDYKSNNLIILSVDSSIMAVGIILSQLDENGRKRPARYGSLPFSGVECRYAQSKLELYGLYRAMRHFRLYSIGAKNLIVEVDAKYIKGMLNEPDLQPNAAIKRWIQGILLFNFTLKHVPDTQFKGPDTLFRRRIADDETVQPHDDSWLDYLSLFCSHVAPISVTTTSTRLLSGESQQATVLSGSANQEQTLEDIFHYLTNPASSDPPVSKQFLKKVTKYFVAAGRMFKRMNNGKPLLVIFDVPKRLELLTQAHEQLGHKGEKATWEII